MEIMTEKQKVETKEFVDFYVDMVEKCCNTIKYYLSEDVVLDWFGQTVKGEKNVANFFKSNIAQVNHDLCNALPVTKIGFRDTHVVKINKEPKKFETKYRPTHCRIEDALKTPPRQTEPSTSSKHPLEKGQGDGFHNNCDLPELSSSPAKKLKLTPQEDSFTESDTEIVESETENQSYVKYMTAEGSVMFHKRSLKKLQSQTKWKRPCKLSIAYSWTSPEDCTIYLIIYEGNVKCRRNLMKDFDQVKEAQN